MMRRLVDRHKGILPLDTAESIWRVIISTFTYVQAPFSVHADLSAGDAAMRDSARFHFGFTVPFVPHMGAASVVAAVSDSKGDLGLVPAFAMAGAGAWWNALEFDSAPKIIARLPFVDRADHPAAVPVFVVSRAAPDAMVREVEMWSVRVAGWSTAAAQAVGALAEVIAVPDRAFDGAALLISVPHSASKTRVNALNAGSIDKVTDTLVEAGASVRASTLVGSHATRYRVEANNGRLGVDMMSAATRPQPRPGVLAIDPYVPGKSTAPGVARVFKLSSNETPLGPSPQAIAAYHELGKHLEDYPDGASTALREAIGRAFGLDPDRIVCGAGSDDLLNLIADAYLCDGDEAIHTTHGFLVYPIATLGSGATPIVAAEKNYTADVDAMLAAVSERTKVVFLANPNNPTGTYVPFDEVKRLHRGLPPHVLLVLDAAYAEYVRRNDYEAGIELVATSENVVMLRTFSKIYGLAALRLGWLYGPAHVVDAINRIRGPFNVNAAAMAAGIAAIADTAHVEASRAHNEKWLAWLTVEIRKLGLEVTPSIANFVLIHFPDRKGRTAEDADAFLTRRGLILRRVKAYKLPNALRMTVGSEEANRLVVAALAEFMSGKDS